MLGIISHDDYVHHAPHQSTQAEGVVIADHGRSDRRTFDFDPDACYTMVDYSTVVLSVLRLQPFSFRVPVGLN